MFAIGKMSVIGGNAGCNKSTLALSLAALVSKGGKWPDGSRCPQGEVIIMSSEDDEGDTLKPRLRIAGAGLEQGPQSQHGA